MMRRPAKKVDANAPPPPPRDNGLPPKPPELDAAKASLQKELGAHVNVATGFALKEGWSLFVFTDEASLKVPAKHDGWHVHRRSVPKAGPVRPR
jgi:hypothetical protein